MTKTTKDILAMAEREQASRPKKAAARSATAKPRIVIGKSGVPGAKSGRRPMPPQEEIRTADEVMFFTVFDSDHPEVRVGREEDGVIARRKVDDPLVRAVKNAVNGAQIKRRDLYALIDEDDDSAIFRDKNQVYNLEYGLRHRPTITPDCAAKWATCIGATLKFVFEPNE